jgi:hypothetical protein
MEFEFESFTAGARDVPIENDAVGDGIGPRMEKPSTSRERGGRLLALP